MRKDVLIALVTLLALGSESSLAQPGQALTQGDQKAVDAAVGYFEGGGAWTFRFGSSGAASAGGSVVVLRRAHSKLLLYTLGSFQFDPPPKDPAQMVEVIAMVPSVLEDARTRAVFAARFAKGIEAGRLEAYVLNRPSGQDKKPFPLEGGSFLKAAELMTFFRLSVKE